MNNKIEEDFKPRKWLLAVLIIAGLVVSVFIVNKIVEDTQNKSLFSLFGDMFDFDKKKFNSEFEFGSGSTDGFFIDSYLDKVIKNNKTNDKHKITVVYNEISTQDEEEIRNIKYSFNSDMNIKLDVVLDYDDKGYVNKVTIKEVGSSDISEMYNDAFNEAGATTFNFSFNDYSGNQKGKSIKELLDKVISNNKENADKIISVTYNDTNTNDEEGINNFISMFDNKENDELNVELRYSEKGYINMIVIK